MDMKLCQPLKHDTGSVPIIALVLLNSQVFLAYHDNMASLSLYPLALTTNYRSINRGSFLSENEIFGRTKAPGKRRKGVVMSVSCSAPNIGSELF